jgi:ABC-type phosphate transport system substrate-binding protein
MNRRTFLIGIGVAAFVWHSGGGRAHAEGDDIAVVVNKANVSPPMNRSQLSALFKARSTQFPRGGRATPVNLPPESSVRQAFDMAVLGLTPEEVERFWLDSKIRSGTGSPRHLPGPSALVRFVSGDETSIGYVPVSELSDAVRVVARIRGGQVLAP